MCCMFRVCWATLFPIFDKLRGVFCSVFWVLWPDMDLGLGLASPQRAEAVMVCQVASKDHSSQHIVPHHQSSPLITTYHHSASLIITHHHTSSHIITHHHSSSLIITHHHSSSLIITHHPSSSLIMAHHHSSSLIIAHHHSSLPNITHHHSSSLIINIVSHYQHNISESDRYYAKERWGQNSFFPLLTYFTSRLYFSLDFSPPSELH
jgi:hypothetical protein